MPLKVAFYTLGCKVNYYETEALKGKFRREGFEIVDFSAIADAYVINTCTVTHLADRKSRQIIRRAKKRNPEALVAVTGCYAQVNPAAVASLSQADLILGTAERLALPELVKKKLSGNGGVVFVRPHGESAVFEDLPWLPEQGRTRAFLKIQDGCNQFCSYCIVPLARGPLRSLPPAKGLQYLQEISRAGYKEVVVCGIHLGLYGVDLQPATDLASFLARAIAVQGIERLRLSSIEPSDFGQDLIRVIKDHEKICRHLHIPLQSGDSGILKKMGRPYDTAFYAGLLNRLREAVPDLAVSTDIMVGFPGERDEHFYNSLNFVRECAFSRLHVFKYSPRQGTRAAGMTPHVEPAVKDKRSGEMIELGKELSLAFQKRFLGRRLTVLFEKKLDPGLCAGDICRRQTEKELLLEGLTSNYLRVRTPAAGNLLGQIGEVFIEKSCRGYLKGSLLQRERGRVETQPQKK